MLIEEIAALVAEAEAFGREAEAEGRRAEMAEVVDLWVHPSVNVGSYANTHAQLQNAAYEWDVTGIVPVARRRT